MNIEYKEKIEQLKKHVKMEDPQDIELFEKLVWELAETQDVEVLSELIDLFDDDCPFPEVMYSLVHAIDMYPDNLYTKVLILKIKNFSISPEWIEILIYRTLNHTESLKILENNLKQEINKEEFLFVLDIMAIESKEHANLIQRLKHNVQNETMNLGIKTSVQK